MAGEEYRWATTTAVDTTERPVSQRSQIRLKRLQYVLHVRDKKDLAKTNALISGGSLETPGNFADLEAHDRDWSPLRF